MNDESIIVSLASYRAKERAERLLEFLLEGASSLNAYGQTFEDADDIEFLMDQMDEAEAIREEQEEMRSDAVSRNRALISSYREAEDR
jgi:hypothetical protein